MKDVWSLEEVAEITDGLGLMAEGALDTINEAAWDQVGDPLLEIEEDVTVDNTVLQELLA